MSGLHATADSSLSDEPRLEIRAVDTGGNAVPITSAAFVGDGQIRWTDEHRGLVSIARERGCAAAPDRDGTWFGSFRSSGLVVVESDGRRGVSHVSKGQRQVEVLLRPQRAVRVQLQDHLGRPAEGVVVQLVRWDSPDRNDWRLEQRDGVTDAKGMATLEGLELLPWLEEGQTFRVMPVIPGLAGVAQEVPSADGEVDILMSLPETRSLILQDDSSSSWGGARRVGLSMSEEDELWRPVQGRRVTFERVALGCFLFARWITDTGEFELDVAPLKAHAEPAVATAEPDHVRPCQRVWLRLLDRDDQPLEESSIGVRRMHVTPAGTRWSVPEGGLATGADGWVVRPGGLPWTDRDLTDVWMRRVGDDPWMEFEDQESAVHQERLTDEPSLLEILRRTGTFGESFVLHAVVPLPLEEASAGRSGKLAVVAAGQGLATLHGRAVDKAGQPVSGVSVKVDVMHEGAQIRLSSEFGGSSAEDGSFAVQVPADFATGTVVLRVSEGPWIAELKLAAAQFARKARLVLSAAPGFSFPNPSFEFPRGGRRSLHWELTEESTGAWSAGGGVWSGPLPSHLERIFLRDLDSGRYTLTFAWDQVEVARFEGVRISSDSASVDRRVESWDLREQTRRACLRVVDDRGGRPESLSLTSGGMGGVDLSGPNWRGFWESDHREFDFILPAVGGVPVFVEADGACPERFILEADKILTLRPSTTVRVGLRKGDERPTLARGTELALRWVSSEQGRESLGCTTWRGNCDHGVWALTDPSAKVEVASGDYEVRWCVVSRDPETVTGGFVQELDQPARTFLHVAESEETRTIEVSFPPGLIDVAERVSVELAGLLPTDGS